MDAETFVATVREVVRDQAVSGSLRMISKPPGRRPSEKLKALCAWYTDLDPSSRQMLAQALELVADSATYRFILVLDGAMAIENGAEKGRLELSHIGIERRLLNDPAGPSLQELYKTGR